MEAILHGIPVKSFDLAAVAVSNGTEFALPARAALVTWQHYYTVDPTTVTVLIQLSVDGTIWDTGDTDSTAAGVIRTFETSARFIRARISAQTGSGTEINVDIVTKAID